MDRAQVRPFRGPTVNLAIASCRPRNSSRGLRMTFCCLEMVRILPKAASRLTGCRGGIFSGIKYRIQHHLMHAYCIVVTGGMSWNSR